MPIGQNTFDYSSLGIGSEMPDEVKDKIKAANQNAVQFGGQDVEGAPSVDELNQIQQNAQLNLQGTPGDFATIDGISPVAREASRAEMNRLMTPEFNPDAYQTAININTASNAFGSDAGAGMDELSGQSQEAFNQSWENLMGQFDQGFGRIEQNKQDQLGGVAARGSMNARRGAEMGALQGASGFGGMQAGKQLQGQMATNEFERQIRNDSFEQEMGLRKGQMNAIQQKATTDLNAAISRGDSAEIARIQSTRDALNAWMNLDPLDRGEFDLEEIMGTGGEE